MSQEKRKNSPKPPVGDPIPGPKKEKVDAILAAGSYVVEQAGEIPYLGNPPAFGGEILTALEKDFPGITSIVIEEAQGAVGNTASYQMTPGISEEVATRRIVNPMLSVYLLADGKAVSVTSLPAAYPEIGDMSFAYELSIFDASSLPGFVNGKIKGGTQNPESGIRIKVNNILDTGESYQGWTAEIEAKFDTSTSPLIASALMGLNRTVADKGLSLWKTSSQS